MDLNFCTFRSEWEVAYDPSDAYRALEAIEDYPVWWREVRSVRQISEDEYDINVRSMLPYGLRFVGTIARQDPDVGVLKIGMRGDLDGFSRWTITRSGAGANSRSKKKRERTGRCCVAWHRSHGPSSAPITN